MMFYLWSSAIYKIYKISRLAESKLAKAAAHPLLGNHYINEDEDHKIFFKVITVDKIWNKFKSVDELYVEYKIDMNKCELYNPDERRWQFFYEFYDLDGEVLGYIQNMIQEYLYVHYLIREVIEDIMGNRPYNESYRIDSESFFK